MARPGEPARESRPSDTGYALDPPQGGSAGGRMGPGADPRQQLPAQGPDGGTGGDTGGGTGGDTGGGDHVWGSPEYGQPPLVLGGRYRLLGKLGSGGMGTVWHGRDETMNRDVAIKELHLPPSLAPEQRATASLRMQREARAAARIDHPAVITVHDVIIEGERPWIVMELLRGRSLAHVLAESVLPPREAARIGLAVLGALSAAHEVGVLHRDVKPANVMLGRHDRVILTDFGIAQVEGESHLTEVGAFLGSPEYMAPERALGRELGPESDLWSLGVLLYQAVEGVSPFHRSHAMAALHAIVESDPPTMERAGPLAELIVALLRKVPSERPTAAQAADVLQAVAHGPVQEELPGQGWGSVPGQPVPGEPAVGQPVPGVPVQQRFVPPQTMREQTAYEHPAYEHPAYERPAHEQTAVAPPNQPAGTAVFTHSDAVLQSGQGGGLQQPAPSTPSRRGRRRMVLAVTAGVVVLAALATAVVLLHPFSKDTKSEAWKTYDERGVGAKVAVPASYVRSVDSDQSVTYTAPKGVFVVRLYKLGEGARNAAKMSAQNLDADEHDSTVTVGTSTINAARLQGRNASQLEETYRLTSGAKAAKAKYELNVVDAKDNGYTLDVTSPGTKPQAANGRKLFARVKNSLKITSLT